MKTAFLIDFKSGGDNKSITVNSQRMIYMKKNKLILASVAALMAVSPVLSFGSQTHTVQAATNSVQKIIMHTAVGYDPDGRNTGIKLYPYKTVNVDATPVLINGKWKLYKGETVTTYGGSYKFKNSKCYFRIGGPQKQYVKASNLGPVVGLNTPQASGKATVNYVRELQ